MEEKTCVLLKYILTALDKQSMIGIPSRRTGKTVEQATRLSVALNLFPDCRRRGLGSCRAR